jgi:hypothetical protein
VIAPPATPRATPRPTHQPDPPQDQPGKPIPPGIAEALILTRALIAYGHHLCAIMPMGRLWSAFATVARYLGGTSLDQALQRIQRGTLRAIALENVLRRRAEAGRDLRVLGPHLIHPRPARSRAPAAQPRPEPDPVPTLQQLEAQVSRRPIGHSLTAISLDLGISPSLCTGRFWDRMFQALISYRGNLVHLTQELHRREDRFGTPLGTDNSKPGALPPPPTRERIHHTLGFFVGEPPRLPPWPRHPPALAAGTGPP